MRQIITKFTDNDLYTFTCQYYVLKKYPHAEVGYTFFDRNKTKYPKGFGELLKEQMEGLRNVVLTDEEAAFMLQNLTYLPQWYITFLKGYRFNPDELTIEQDEDGYLHVSATGKWWSTIMWEMPVLSTIAELSHILNGDADKYDAALERKRAHDKAVEIFDNGLVLGDMGTRRRFSFEHQRMVLEEMTKVYNEKKWSGVFTGTSNVWFAKEFGLKCLGTMSHQIISFEETISGPLECNYAVMKKFNDVYDGQNLIFLYDCFGEKAFFSNASRSMLMLYRGLRIDSGIEEDQTEKIIAKYQSYGINPAEKQIIYSNGLNIKRAIEIHKFVNGRVKDSYGVGTFLTCDVTGVQPSNIVMKLTKARYNNEREWVNCVKLSCDKGKTLGDETKCKYLLSLFGVETPSKVDVATNQATKETIENIPTKFENFASSIANSLKIVSTSLKGALK